MEIKIIVILLTYFIFNVENNIDISYGQHIYRYHKLDIIPSIIEVILRNGTHPLAAVVLQANCHLSNEVLKQVQAIEYFPTLTINIQQNNASDLKEIFPDELVLFGLMKIPNIIFWLIENYDDSFWTFLGKFRDTFLGNPRTPFIIIFVSQDENEINRFKEDCKKTWDEYRILNIILIKFPTISLPNSRDRPKHEFPSQNLSSIAWFFNQFKNNGNFIKLSKSRMSKLNIFTDKLKNTNGYEFKVTKGRSIDILKSVYLSSVYKAIQYFIKSMNGTIKVIKPKISNEINSGNMNSVPDIFGNMMPKYTKNMFITSDFAIIDCMKLILPKAQRVPQYMNIILPFTSGTWSLLFLSVPIVVMLWKLFRMDASSELVLILETIRIFTTGSTIMLVNSSSYRGFIISCLLLSLIMMNSYMGGLTSYLTKPHYYPDINTVEQLFKSSLWIAVPKLEGLSDDIKSFIQEADPNDQVVQTLLNRAVFVPNMKAALDTVAFNRTAGYVDSDILAKMYTTLNDYKEDGYPLIHIMEDCPLLLLICIPFPYVSPLQDRININIRRLVEMGFPIKWIQDDEYEVTLSAMTMDKSVDRKSLKMGHVQTPFYILLVGLTLGLICMICEMLVHKLLTY